MVFEMPLTQEYAVADSSVNFPGIYISMLERIRPVLSTIGYIASWLILSSIATLTIFQIHTIVLSIALRVVENPSTRPVGWSTDTIHGLSRIAWLILGILLLLWVVFTEEYLREGNRYRKLKKRATRLFLIIVTVYIVCYGILFVIA